MQLTASGDLEFVRVLGVLHAQGDVVLEFALQALAQLARGDELAVAAGEGRGVDHEVHAHRGSSTSAAAAPRRDWDRTGVRDVQALHAGEGDDVAGRGFRKFHPLQPQEAQDLQDAARRRWPSGSITTTCVLVLTRPRLMRPMPIRPT